MNDLIVLVLAGGSGTRFWPIETHKVLLPFAGNPFITTAVSSVIPKQTSKVILVGNELNYRQLDALPFPVPHMIVIQKESKGMADAILTAKAEIAHHSILILIADDLLDGTLFQRIVDYGEKNNDTFAVLPGWRPKTYFPGGYLSFEHEKVTGIVEKPGADNLPSDLMNISGHFYQDSDVLIEALSKTSSSADDVYERAVTSLMGEKPFHILPYDGNFLSLKYPWHILSAMDEMLKTVEDYKGSGVQIKENVFIEGPVHFGSNVKIFENTKIVGPVYIGDNTIIGNNNVIRHSMIGANCVTGFNTDITRSYVGDSCWFHSNYLGDSVLEGNVSMGSGTVLANLRLDEGDIPSVVKGQKISTERNKLGAIIGKNVRIGVNSSIMPGIKIGSNSLIGGGITIAQDIPTNSFVKAKTELIIEQNTKEVSSDREEFKKKI